jgi:tetratricopeptide (TPR) repeat protein
MHWRTHCYSCELARGAVLFALSAIVLASSSGCRISANGHNVDGVRSYQVGEYQKAIQSFQQALIDDPDNSDAYYNLAATYYDLGKRNADRSLLAQAEGLYHQCLDLKPDHTACYRGLAALLVDTNRSDSAFTLLQRWSQRSHDLAEPRIELARLYQEFGDRESAVRYLTDALNVDSANPRAWTALGQIREQQGQLAQALSNYEQAFNLNNFQPGLAQHIATLQRQIVPGGLTPQGTQIVTQPSGIPR